MVECRVLGHLQAEPLRKLSPVCLEGVSRKEVVWLATSLVLWAETNDGSNRLEKEERR